MTSLPAPCRAVARRRGSWREVGGAVVSAGHRIAKQTRPWQFPLRLLAAALLTALIAATVDLPVTVEVLRRARPGLVAMTALVSALSVVVSAMKWRRLLSHAGVAMPKRRAIGFYWIGMFFSNFLPTSVGGDAVRVLLTARGAPAATAVASVLVERLTGLLVMLLQCAVMIVIRPGELRPPQLDLVIDLGVPALGLMALAFLILPRRLAALGRGTRRGGVSWAAHLSARLGALGGDAAGRMCGVRPLAEAFGVSALFYLTIIAAQYGVLHAAGASIPLREVILLAPIVPLLSLLPVTINGIGLAEGVFVLVYSQAGVSPEIALAAALLRRLVDLGNSSIGGALWLLWRDPSAGTGRT